MSYTIVVEHIERILNQCGDPVHFTLTEYKAPHESGHISLEIKKVAILKKNNCCAEMPEPSPLGKNNPPGKYWVNRIRISHSLSFEYSRGNPMSDEEIKGMIRNKKFLFGYH